MSKQANERGIVVNIRITVLQYAWGITKTMADCPHGSTYVRVWRMRERERERERERGKVRVMRSETQHQTK